MKRIRRAAAALGLVLLAAFGVLLTPQPLFAHQMTYGRYHLWSDRPIDAPAARRVLDDADRRIVRSELFTPDQRFAIFLCNDNWRLALYSQRFSGKMGGATDSAFTGNIYLRQSDLALNRLIPARGWTPALAERPLAYYIAHEATHTLQGRAFGPLNAVAYPHWLREGYADYVGKAGQFDVARNLADLKAGAPEMDWAKSGLYRRYHLEVAYLIDHKGESVRRLYAEKPDEASVLKALQADPTFGK